MTPPRPARRATDRTASLLRLFRLLAARVLGALFVVWAAVTAAFWAVAAVPGDPVEVMLGPLAGVSAAGKDRLRSELGLDRPLLERYGDTLASLARGDLGESYQLRQPVAEALGGAFPPTARLAVLALGIALALVLIGALLGRGRLGAGLVGTAEVLAVVLPSFWVGFLLITVFSFWLGWFPATGSRTAASQILPAVTLAIPVAGVLGQAVRAELADVAASPFALSAAARGLGPSGLLARHGLRHAAVPASTLIAYVAGGLLGGAILVETVFSRPGLGSLTLTAILNRDMPVIIGLVAVSAALFALLGVLADLGVWLADPRTRRAAAPPRPQGQAKTGGARA